MTRLILATQPWSQVAMTEVVIWAMPRAMASPLVVISTTYMEVTGQQPEAGRQVKQQGVCDNSQVAIDS